MKRNGFTIIEMIAVLLVMGFLSMFFAQYMSMGATQLSKQAAAKQLVQVADAATLYIADNYDALQNTATDTSAAVVNLSDIISGGYLPESFGKNPWKQTYVLYVLEPTGKNLEGLVLTSGGMPTDDEFENLVIPSTAALAGSVAGYVPTGLISGQSSSVIKGAFGGWKLDISGTDITNPGAGHLAAYLPFSHNAATSDYLYRSSVPLHPELNQMWTTLDMYGNDIEMGDGSSVGNVGGGDNEGVRSLNFEDTDYDDFSCDNSDDEEGRIFWDDANDKIYICEDGAKRTIQTSYTSAYIKDISLVTTGDSVAKPDCPDDLTDKQIFLYPASFAANTTGRYLKGVQVWADSISSAYWRVNMQIMTDQGWVTPSTQYGKMVVVTKCSP